MIDISSTVIKDSLLHDRLKLSRIACIKASSAAIALASDPNWAVVRYDSFRNYVYENLKKMAIITKVRVFQKCYPLTLVILSLIHI